MVYLDTMRVSEDMGVRGVRSKWLLSKDGQLEYSISLNLRSMWRCLSSCLNTFTLMASNKASWEKIWQMKPIANKITMGKQTISVLSEFLNGMQSGWRRTCTLACCSSRSMHLFRALSVTFSSARAIFGSFSQLLCGYVCQKQIIYSPNAEKNCNQTSLWCTNSGQLKAKWSKFPNAMDGLSSGS